MARWVAFSGCRIFFSKENWGEILEGMYDLHLNCLRFAFIDFKLNKNILCWNSFKNFQKMEKTFSCSQALQDLQHFRMNFILSRKYIEIISKPEQKVIWGDNIIWCHIEYLSHFNSHNAVTWFREIKSPSYCE